ncbi:TetR/AcrR family transcriptional regulator [Streptomyces lunaelactis]|uniref:TetR/AcrR family transcriptional regulator n=1 Tax=Streptomyces lunaelactis TaxID=1535768 RepID=UPI001584596F|nr:TetR/AcrR family transcriptional regulator [Streptomyces lunaelactis]NUK37727.1 TetR/AcrR family transcriptional regulator [Streptomyces lunaelactis]NUK44506.1 TetR/AcrR family transcriptional regulator [Streptomyces lunaelactis]NUK95310.1 TetR/AcrR family transcriptional regulator [Streptomyces lunaelactis]NUL11143.1 TetR/AcrR family transcriptional regulator [Streptomyces lunaelactis]NUL26068.1 TetR/AcrR family transcriptional regulator [Streptomyces lunaelactis]
MREQHERGRREGAGSGAGRAPGPAAEVARGRGASRTGASGTGASATGASGAKSSSPAQRRGRPRSEAVERSIVEAVVRLFEEGLPLSELSIERIARTAGVGKATIYRRWKGKEALLVDVVRSMEPVDPPLPGTSVRDDLVAMIEMLRQRGLAKRSSALLHNVFAQMHGYPKLWDMYHRTSVLPRRQLMDEVLRRGIQNGEIRADIDFDLLGDLFVGPMLVRTVLRSDGTPGEGSAEQIVDAVLAGVRAPR